VASHERCSITIEHGGRLSDGIVSVPAHRVVVERLWRDRLSDGAPTVVKDASLQLRRVANRVRQGPPALPARALSHRTGRQRGGSGCSGSGSGPAGTA